MCEYAAVSHPFLLLRQQGYLKAVNMATANDRFNIRFTKNTPDQTFFDEISVGYVGQKQNSNLFNHVFLSVGLIPVHFNTNKQQLSFPNG